MKSPLGSAGCCAKQVGALLSVAIFALSGPLSFGASPKSKASSGVPNRAADDRAPGSVVFPTQRPEFVDAFPSQRPAAADLLLTKDEERKADALAAFAQGLVAEDNAEADAALAAYRKAFELDPSNPDLAVKVAYELAKRNDPSGGIQVLKDAIKASPKAPLPLIYLSQLYSKYLKKPDLAMKYAEQALAMDSNYFPSWLAVFELTAVSGDVGRVEQLLQRASRATSTDPEFWLRLGNLYQRVHLKDDGASASPEALKQMNIVFRKAADLGKNNASVLAKVGNYFVDSRQVKEALPLYFAAFSLQQNSADPVVANAREKFARALIQTGQRDEAISILEQIAKDHPLRFETFELLGSLYEEKGDIDSALANYQHSILLDASSPRNHLRITELEMRMKRYEEAVATAKAARAKFPDSAEAAYLLPIALSQAKKHTEAMNAFAEAQAVFESDHEELLNSQFYFSYGAAAEQAGLTDRAAELLKKSIELDPANSAQAYNYLGYMWADRGEHMEEAGEMIKKAVEMEPDNGAYLDSLGWYYFKSGEYEKALQHLLHAAELIKPDDPVVFEHIGDAYQQAGKGAEALRYWQKALALDEENRKIAEKIDAAKQKISSKAGQEPKSPADHASHP